MTLPWELAGLKAEPVRHITRAEKVLEEVAFHPLLGKYRDEGKVWRVPHFPPCVLFFASSPCRCLVPSPAHRNPLWLPVPAQERVTREQDELAKIAAVNKARVRAAAPRLPGLRCLPCTPTLFVDVVAVVCVRPHTHRTAN